MNKTSLNRSFLRLTTLAMAFLASSAVMAQTSYTLRKLPPAPNLTTKSRVSIDALGNNGDVAGILTTVTGTRTAYALGLGFYQTSITTQRVVHWPAGGSVPRTLPVASGTNVRPNSIQGVDSSGRILALVQGVFSSSWVWWSGTQRTTLAPSLTRFNTTWQLGRVNSNGEVPAFTNYNKKARVAIVSGKSTARELPAIPDSQLTEGQAEIRYSYATSNAPLSLNDKGQVALVVSPFYDAIDRSATDRVWLWDGKAWLNVTPPAPVTPAAPLKWRNRLAVLSVNNAGQVLVFDEGYVSDPVTGGTGDTTPHALFLVTPGSGAVRLPPMLTPGDSAYRVRLAHNGDVLFAQEATNSAGQPSYEAAIYRNGQVLSVNSLTALPAGESIFSVQDVNAKGQMLVEVQDGAASSYSAVLSPR